MSQYATLTAAIQQVIKQNGNNEITGNILQQTLLSMVTSLGAYYQFAGVAVPATNPGTPDQRVCYIAGPGTYPNFGATVVPGGSIGIFAYNSAWVYTVMSISQVVDNLTTADATKSLSANQGVVLDGKIKDANTNVGLNIFEIAKIGDFAQVTGTGTVISPTETLGGYYNVETKQWGNDAAFTFRKFPVTAGKYYDIFNRVQGVSDTIASLVLFKNGTPIHIARYPENSHFYVKAVNFDQIGLMSTSSTLTQYDSVKMLIPAGSVNTEAVADGAITNQKIADAAVGASKLQDNGVTIEKIAFKTTIYGTNRLDPNAVSAGYINVNNGAFVANSDRLATDFIPVSTNGLYCYITNWYGTVGKAAVYDANKQFLRGLDSPAYTYQDGDAYVRWTLDNRYLANSYVIEGTQPGTYVPYTPPKQVINAENIPEIGTNQIANGAVTPEKLAPGITFPATLPAISLCGKPAVKATAASIAAGGSLQISDFPQYLKANGVVSFSAKLTTFNELFVGFGNGGTNSIQVRIDGTDVQIVKSGSQTWQNYQWAHGLTISDFIDVTFNNDWLNPKIVVATKSGIFVQPVNQLPSLEMYGLPTAVMGSGTSVTNAELRATADKFNKPIWAIGDSYTSLYTERWTYQMVKTIGIDKFLIIGLAGGGSSGLFADLQKALAFGTPKFLIWCLGMNDTYSAWSTVIEQVKALCAANGIELIMQTIPIPNLSTSNNQIQINAAVRSSGYRYIDACAAMCPNNNWPWYDNYTEDGVHPTELGAKVLVARFLSDFPEFMQ